MPGEIPSEVYWELQVKFVIPLILVVLWAQVALSGVLWSSATCAGANCNEASNERRIGMTIPMYFIVDGNGDRRAMILSTAEYEKLIEETEELEAIRAYDAAEAARDEAIPFEQAVAEIERDRK